MTTAPRSAAPTLHAPTLHAPTLPRSAAPAVLTAPQAALVDEIKAYHAGVRRSYEHQIQYALLAGLKLTTLKDTCPHGQFIPLRETHLPEISKSAAGRYMDFFSLCQSKFPTVGNIKGSNLLLQNGELPEPEKKAVLDAVYQAADGKTWTQFYRDLDLCRQKKPHEYHPPKPTSPNDAEAAARQAADDLAKQLLADLDLLQQNDTWSLLSTDRQHEIEDARIQLGAFIKKNSPKRKPKRPKHLSHQSRPSHPSAPEWLRRLDH